MSKKKQWELTTTVGHHSRGLRDWQRPFEGHASRELENRSGRTAEDGENAEETEGADAETERWDNGRRLPNGAPDRVRRAPLSPSPRTSDARKELNGCRSWQVFELDCRDAGNTEETRGVVRYVHPRASSSLRARLHCAKVARTSAEYIRTWKVECWWESIVSLICCRSESRIARRARSFRARCPYSSHLSSSSRHLLHHELCLSFRTT